MAEEHVDDELIKNAPTQFLVALNKAAVIRRDSGPYARAIEREIIRREYIRQEMRTIETGD